MRVLVDTSAFYALLSVDDEQHARAAAELRRLAGATSHLLTHAYVVVETTALVRRRLGPIATRELHRALLGPVDLVVIDGDTHRAAVTALLAAPERDVSLVDWTSFEVMRRLGIDVAFAFDPDFAREGFETVP